LDEWTSFFSSLSLIISVQFIKAIKSSQEENDRARRGTKTGPENLNTAGKKAKKKQGHQGAQALQMVSSPTKAQETTAAQPKAYNSSN
jgi:hypothetical protein